MARRVLPLLVTSNHHSPARNERQGTLQRGRNDDDGHITTLRRDITRRKPSSSHRTISDATTTAVAACHHCCQCERRRHLPLSTANANEERGRLQLSTPMTPATVAASANDDNTCRSSAANANEEQGWLQLSTPTTTR